MQVTLGDTDDLKRLVKALRQHADGKELRKELTAALREVANPIRDEVKRAYLGAPGFEGRYSRSRGARPPLRSLLAKATRVEVRTTGRLAGVRVRVDGRRMPAGMRSLPRYWEGDPGTLGRGRWRHPVFGDRETWVQQRPRPTFYRTVAPYEDDARRAVTEVLEGVRRKLEQGR